MYLSHKGTFVAAATIFSLGLFLTVLISDNLGQPLTTGSQAQTPANTSVTPVPGTTANPNIITCQMCDVDGSGIIDAADLAMVQRILVIDPTNVKAQAYLAFCTQFANPPTPVTACSTATGTVPGPTRTLPPGGPAGTTGAPLPTGPNGGSPAPTGSGTSGLGDCNSIQGPGQKDGATNALDYELLRQELSSEVQTTHCDGDGNGSVDIVDFTNYWRVGFNS